MASWAAAMGRAGGRLERELLAWYTAMLLQGLQCGVAFAPEKVDWAALVPLQELPGSHCDSSQVFLELQTIGSRL